MRKAIPSVLALAALVTTGACSRTTTVESGGEVAAATPVSASSLPTGAVVTVTLDQAVGTKNSKVGDTFTATVAEAITTSNGQTVVPAGSKVYGKVTGLQDSDNAGQKAAIRLDFERINVNGVERPFEANITTTQLQTQKEETRDETLKKAGIGAAAGAVLGAVIGGGGITAATEGKEIDLPQGTVLRVRLDSPVSIQPAR